MAKDIEQKNLEDIEGEKPKKKWKVKKIICASLIALLLAWWAASYFDIKKSKERKKADIEQYGKFNINTDGTATYQVDNLDWGPDPFENIPLDTILNYNRDTISVEATNIGSIILWEDVLTTDKKFLHFIDMKKQDSILASKWVDRNPESESMVWKVLGRIDRGSYSKLNVQIDAIDKYKDDPILYDNLCRKIAGFKLPDKNWEYMPLHELLWLTMEEMVKKIKNHEIYIFRWGERFLVAYWIVLIDQIDREANFMISSYNFSRWYNRWIANTKKVEKEHPDLRKAKDNIMSPYILSNSGKVSYSRIWELFNNDAFVNWMVSAYRCMDYINNINNSDYLFILSLMELNEWFNNPQWELNILTPTWRFWPSTRELVNKHFNQNFKDNDDAKEFMENLSTDTLQKLKEDWLNQFEQNMRLLYTLNPADNSWVNQTQSKYLSECLDLTFNHVYAGVSVLSQFISENCWKNNIDTINDSLLKYWYSYISDQNTESLENIKKIMTDEKTFITFTWLNKSAYLLRIKSYLCPTLLWSTDRVYQTRWIIPVIQMNEWWEWSRKEEWLVNETNSIHRFHLWVEQEQMAQQLREQWLEYILQPWDANIDSLKQIMRSKKVIREYLQKCKTINGSAITSPQDVPDELVNWMIWWSDWTNPLFENWEWFYEWDTIYMKYLWVGEIWYKIQIDKPVTKTVTKTITKKKKQVQIRETVKLCTVNPSGILTMQESWTFQEVLFVLSKTNPEIKQLIESLKWSEINSQNEITQDIIKKIIRRPDWSKWSNINKVNKGQGFIIVCPLNY